MTDLVRKSRQNTSHQPSLLLNLEKVNFEQFSFYQVSTSYAAVRSNSYLEIANGARGCNDLMYTRNAYQASMLVTGSQFSPGEEP